MKCLLWNLLFQAFLLSLLCLLFSILLSSPLFIFTKLEVKKTFLTDEVRSYCYEVDNPYWFLSMSHFYFKDWPGTSYYLAYSFTCFSLQYLLPCIIVGVIYSKLCLSFPSTFATPSEPITPSVTRKIARRKKTNLMLILVSIIFFLSWAPINIYNVFLDIVESFQVFICFTSFLPHSLTQFLQSKDKLIPRLNVTQFETILHAVLIHWSI